jgi:lipopolysaccharide/colanic/teichoic acid biosynthesis glycosyltransferase
MLLRLFDIFFSLIAILVLSPILVFIMLILCFTGEREIFFKQDRVGRYCENFDVLKFATMLKNSPSLGAGNITLPGDPRVLPLGRILRKTKMNELPQLFNILRGNMSVIGPRPLTPDQFSHYASNVAAEIFTNRPGLSGIGSIIFRDEESLLGSLDDPQDFYKNYIAPYKEELELWYARRGKLSDYFLLIFLTCWTVVFPRSNLVVHIFPSLPKPNPRLGSLMAIEKRTA